MAVCVCVRVNAISASTYDSVDVWSAARFGAVLTFALHKLNFINSQALIWSVCYAAYICVCVGMCELALHVGAVIHVECNFTRLKVINHFVICIHLFVFAGMCVCVCLGVCVRVFVCCLFLLAIILSIIAKSVVRHCWMNMYKVWWRADSHSHSLMSACVCACFVSFTGCVLNTVCWPNAFVFEITWKLFIRTQCICGCLLYIIVVVVKCAVENPINI